MAEETFALEIHMNPGFVTPNTTLRGPDNMVFLMTPPIDKDYWLFRVPVSDQQAVVGFPKFGTIGIGFQVEDDDWNTNLPYQAEAAKIAAHIAVNKGDESIPDERVLKAIQMIQTAVIANSAWLFPGRGQA